jgi:hypothetical protein
MYIVLKFSTRAPVSRVPLKYSIDVTECFRAIIFDKLLRIFHRRHRIFLSDSYQNIWWSTARQRSQTKGLLAFNAINNNNKKTAGVDTFCFWTVYPARCNACMGKLWVEVLLSRFARCPTGRSERGERNARGSESSGYYENKNSAPVKERRTRNPV